MASRRNVPRESSERKLSSASIHNSFHKEVDIYIYIYVTMIMKNLLKNFTIVLINDEYARNDK